MGEILGEKALLKSGEIRIGKSKAPIDTNGVYHFEYNKNKNLFKEYSFIDLLNEKVDGSKLKNNIIIVFYKGDKLRPVEASNGVEYNPAEVVADVINSVLFYVEK